MTSPNSTPNPAVQSATSAHGGPLRFDDTRTAFAHRSTRDLRRARWMFGLIGSPQLVSLGAASVRVALALRLPLAWALRPVFDYFCGGEDIDESLHTAGSLSEYGVQTILDYSAEGQTGEAALDASESQIMAAIVAAEGNPQFAFAVFKVSALSDNALLEKVSAEADLGTAESEAWRRVEKRVARLCQAAADRSVPIMIDAEESWLQGAIDRLAEAMMRQHNAGECRVYTTAQLYRHDRLSYVRTLTKTARQEGWVAGVKLVRGAYMEKERERAAAENRPSPIQPDKASTDRDFDAALDHALDHIEHLNIVCGSHNEDSTLRLAEKMRAKGLSAGDGRVAFAQLLGMSDNLSFNLAASGFRTAKYVPYGPLREAIPYLIRRAEENTSVGGQTSRELELIRKELKRRKSA
ncbi:MAG: proline dehydrogenase family protein [Flavobacteriales bacterium]|nr:proline dehydrogenase family protein [Flavobacteriales bacterium]